MTWYYELDAPNDRIRLRFEDDSGTVHGPRDVSWTTHPSTTKAPDGWVVEPDLKEVAGKAATDLYTDVNAETALMALRALAAGQVYQGTP